MNPYSEPMEDVYGAMYAKLSELRKGDMIVVDGGSSCIEPWSKHLVDEDDTGLYVECIEGRHYLEGQATNGWLIGVYHTAKHYEVSK